MFVESRVELQALRFRFESESSHDLVDSIQSRVTKTVESLRVVGLQDRVNVESNRNKQFPYVVFLGFISLLSFTLS